MEGDESNGVAAKAAGYASVIVQIVLIDIVFSLDSVITAVGLASQIAVMIAAIVIAMILMMVASSAISNFVNNRPTIKMLALAFLLLIGLVLVADGFRTARFQRVRLLRDGFFFRSGNAEPPDEGQTKSEARRGGGC